MNLNRVGFRRSDDQTIGKCLCSTVVVVIQANSIILATFGN